MGGSDDFNLDVHPPKARHVVKKFETLNHHHHHTWGELTQIVVKVTSGPPNNWLEEGDLVKKRADKNINARANSYVAQQCH